MSWLVNKHNELRARHGVSALTWDWDLAWNAYDFVVRCPDGHSRVPGIGENLAWGHNDFNHAMRDWYDEVRSWPGGACSMGSLLCRPPWVCRAGSCTLPIRADPVLPIQLPGIRRKHGPFYSNGMGKLKQDWLCGQPALQIQDLDLPDPDSWCATGRDAVPSA